MNRREVLTAGASAAALFAGAWTMWGFGKPSKANAETFEVTKTEAEWRAQLDANQYAVLREEATERPGSSPLNHEKRKGVFNCAGCDLPVYSSDTKFDSGTGWPSFWDSMPDAVGKKEDNSLFMTRTEVHCRRCGGHFGHIFDDGPKPTGLRHCLNGVALTFKPATA